MLNELWVARTVLASLVIQAVVGVVDIYGITLKVPEKDQILIDVLKIETFVQVIQFAIYIFLYNQLNLATMAANRYRDWFITTPLMLFTTMLFFEYNRSKEIVTLPTFIATNKFSMGTLFVSNFLMLFFGWLGEIGALSIPMATLLGFAAYGYTFWYLYDRYVKGFPQNQPLFNFFAVVWGIYGVAYWLPTVEKNVAYNGLDIVAKNFFGVYLFWLVYQARIKKTPPK